MMIKYTTYNNKGFCNFVPVKNLKEARKIIKKLIKLKHVTKVEVTNV